MNVVPEMAHWFGMRPADLDDLTRAEIEQFLSRLKKLPPIGGSVMMQPAR